MRLVCIIGSALHFHGELGIGWIVSRVRKLEEGMARSESTLFVECVCKLLMYDTCSLSAEYKLNLTSPDSQ